MSAKREWAVLVMEIFNLSDTIFKFNQVCNLMIFVEKLHFKLLFDPLISVFGFQL
jgi:hypothetical protein